MGIAALVPPVRPAVRPPWSRPLSRDLRHVLDALQAGVIVLDHLGRVDELNAPASRFLELTPESVSGAPVERLLGADHAMARLARTVLAPGVSGREGVPRRG